LASSIKAELEFIQEHGLVEINSPKDIASLSLSFKGCPVVVRTLCEANGALRLSCDSTQLGTEELGEFRAAFSAVFGVPLDRRLHPGRFALGTMGIYEWLFGLSSERESEAIHKEFLDDLIDRRFLVRHTVEAKACCNNLCKRRGTPIEDKSRVVCPKCEQELHEVHFERLEPRTDSIAQFMGEVFQDADDWELAPEMRILDGHEYYELRRHAGTGQEESVCMVIADRPSRELLRVFGSTGLPLLLVKTRDEGRRMRIDDDCSLHVNLSYVLSAQEAQSAKDECREECRSYLTRLLHTHEERVLKAARSSHECISALRRSMTGDEYERHISNLLRRLFPYTYNLGRKGKVEPDGYVCLPHYETSSIEHVGSWNFSYDAKYSAQTNGYDFDIDEARKVITYITKMRRSRRSLFGGNNRARAHVLISNNLSEVKLKRAAQHIFGPDGIAANDSDIRLVLMLQEFLVALYEFVSDRNSELSRRRPVFYDVVIRLFQTAQVGGYLILERSHA
jgi:hypothetical protein